jgi:molecular chaperone DnaJ
MAKNYYDILGLDRKATPDDVKKAFRKLAQKHHPDKGGDESKFKEITEAYSILSDEKRRREYDNYGQAFPGGGAPGGNPFSGFDFNGFSQGFGQGGVEFDLGDIFGDIFGGARARQRRGRDISIDIETSFKEAALGGQREVIITKTGACEICKGSGAKPGTEMDTCKTCNGAGKVHEARNSILGAFSTVRTCPTCEGSGKIPREACKECSGKGVKRKQETIRIRIPAGIDNGEMIRMPGLGEAVKGGATGDLYVKVHVKPHPVFRKDALNLIMDAPIKLTDALLGTTLNIETVDGRTLEVKVPPMTAPEQTLRLREKGISTERMKGDLLINLTVALPKKLSGKAKKAFEQLREEGL